MAKQRCKIFGENDKSCREKQGKMNPWKVGWEDKLHFSVVYLPLGYFLLLLEPETTIKLQNRSKYILVCFETESAFRLFSLLFFARTLPHKQVENA